MLAKLMRLAALSALLMAIFARLQQAEILDRIAVTIEQQAITESQIDEEVRVTAFLNRQAPQWTIDMRRAAADRLIQQYLVEREMKLGRYPAPGNEEVEKYLAGLRETFGGAAAFRKSLASAGLDTDILKKHLAFQLITMRFIEYRFRPSFEISPQEIEAYQKREKQSVSREAARELLIQQRTDEILSTWLEESRKQVNIVYLDVALR